MNILDRVEQRFERLMEGPFNRLLRSAVQPAEIGRRLERAMMTNQVVSVGTVIVPNDFQVFLNPIDLEPYEEFIPGLCRQFVTWLEEIATTRNYTLLGPLRVEIHAGDRVARRQVDIDASITEWSESDRNAPERVDTNTRVIKGKVPGDRTSLVYRIRFNDGPRGGDVIDLLPPGSTVGRADDNTLVIPSRDVSRYHARFEIMGDRVRIVDLGSTNGTRVNGRVVHAHALRPGDEISFGTITGIIMAKSLPRAADQDIER